MGLNKLKFIKRRMHLSISTVQMKEQIQQFIEKKFLFKFENDVTEKSNLFQLGTIDSFGYIQLVSYLEKEFNIKFTEKELLSNALVSLSNIVECVSKKQSKSNKKKIN